MEDNLLIAPRNLKAAACLGLVCALMTACTVGSADGIDPTPLGDALGLELTELSPVDPPSEDALTQTSALTGVSLDALGEATFFDATSKIGRRRTRPLRIAVLPIPASDRDTADPGLTAVLSLDLDGKCTGAAILGPDGTPSAEWKHFYEQFKRKSMPRLSTARPGSILDGLIADARQGTTERDARIRATVELVERMQLGLAMFTVDRPEHEGVPYANDVERATATFRRVVEPAEDVSPLLGDAKAEFIRLAEDSAKQAGGLHSALRRGDLKDTPLVKHRIRRNCAACHGLTGHALGNDGLQEAFRALRAELGVGGSWFRPGYDLRVPASQRRRTQQLADACARSPCCSMRSR